jgi:hypothetical protein
MNQLRSSVNVLNVTVGGINNLYYIKMSFVDKVKEFYGETPVVHIVLFSVIIGLLTWLLCVSIIDYRKKKQKHDEVFVKGSVKRNQSESGIRELYESNVVHELTSGMEFDDILTARDLTHMVLFYQHGCQWCVAMNAAFIKAASLSNTNTRWYKLESKVAGTHLIRQMEIKGFPTLIKFAYGRPEKAYIGNRDVQSLLHYAGKVKKVRT